MMSADAPVAMSPGRSPAPSPHPEAPCQRESAGGFVLVNAVPRTSRASRCAYSSWRSFGRRRCEHIRVRCRRRNARPIGRKRRPSNTPSPRLALGDRAEPAQLRRTPRAPLVSASVMCVAWIRHQRGVDQARCRAAIRPARLPDHARQAANLLVCSAAWMWIGSSIARPSTDRKLFQARQHAGCAARPRCLRRLDLRRRRGSPRTASRTAVEVVQTKRRCRG